MLIKKGNFPIFKLWLACLAMLFACANLARAAQAPPRAPNHVAAEFYDWYLQTLSADQDPLSDRYDTFTGYVSKALTARLVERMKASPRPPDSDYFIQAADYRQAWLHNVRTTLLRQHAGTAEVRVTLGNQAGSQRVLELAMVLEDGAWKIRTVTIADGDFFKSSAEQAAI